MNKYFNYRHRRESKGARLPCRTPGCQGSPLNIELCDARALLEYRLRDDPAAVFHAKCPLCGNESTYDYHTVLSLTVPDLRPIPIPDGCGWAVLLMEFPTADEMPQRAFMGERIFIEALSQSDESWSGYLGSESQLAPTLALGEIVGGREMNAHRVCEGVVRENRISPLPMERPGPGLDIACFFAPKVGHTSMLQCANVTCANPSCAHYFGITYTQFKEQLRDIARTEKSHADGTSGYLILKCEICQTSRVMDARTFDGIFKL